MKLFLYLLIAVLALIIGYKIAEYKDINKKLKQNVIPIVDELKVELASVQEKLKEIALADQDRIRLQDRKEKLMSLLGKFYGMSQTEIEKLINNN